MDANKKDAAASPQPGPSVNTYDVAERKAGSLKDSLTKSQNI